nr:nucleotide-binding alpha-beta plait domain-containing protein [Tanacetum cinerariifolium]
FTPPKKARKFKKPASPKLSTRPVSPEEPIRKSKRVKRPPRKSFDALTVGVVIRETLVKSLSNKKENITVEKRKGIDLLSELAAAKIKPSVRNKGTGVKPEHETNENESSFESDQEENGEDIEDDEEEEEDKFVKTPSNDTNDEDETKIKHKTEGDEDEGMDYTTNQFNDDVNAAASPTEFEIKKILIDKIDESQSYLTAAEHRECYDGLIKSYDLDKSPLSTYDKVYSLKRSQKDKDTDEDPFAGSDRGLKKRKTSKDAKPPKEFEVADSDIPQNQKENLGNDDEEPKRKVASKRDWFTKPKQLEYPIDSDWNEKLDWENLEGDDYPFDLTKPLPFVMNGNCQMVPVDYFFNNDLQYLQGGILTITYTISITKTKSAQYYIPGIEDMAKDLWNVCKQYGQVVDAFIPDRKSKAGKRYGFVRFIRVYDVDRLVSNLCRLWMGSHHLHPNVARFMRPPAVKSDRYTHQNEACEPALLLDESCLNQLDYSLCLLGKVKEFSSFDNMRMVLGNKGFNDIDLRYMRGMWIIIGFKIEDTKAKFQPCLGATSWFSQIIQASKEFVIDERITWVDIEGIPLKLWSESTFTRIAAKWGKMLYLEKLDGGCLYSKRLCILTTGKSNILETFKIIHKEKRFLEDFDSSDVEKEGDNNISMVPDSVKEDVNVQAEEKGNDFDVNNSLDPFEIYPILNKNKNVEEKMDKSNETVSIPFPPGFTPYDETEDECDKKSMGNNEGSGFGNEKGESVSIRSRKSNKIDI